MQLVLNTAAMSHVEHSSSIYNNQTAGPTAHGLGGASSPEEDERLHGISSNNKASRVARLMLLRMVKNERAEVLVTDQMKRRAQSSWGCRTAEQLDTVYKTLLQVSRGQDTVWILVDTACDDARQIRGQCHLSGDYMARSALRMADYTVNSSDGTAYHTARSMLPYLLCGKQGSMLLETSARTMCPNDIGVSVLSASVTTRIIAVLPGHFSFLCGQRAQGSSLRMSEVTTPNPGHLPVLRRRCYH